MEMSYGLTIFDNITLLKETVIIAN